MVFVVFGVAAGVLCAFLRYPFFLLAAIGALLAAGAAMTGIVVGTHPGVIAVEVFGSVAAPQFAFRKRLGLDGTISIRDGTRLIPQVRAGDRGNRAARAEFEVPRSLPPELATLVTQLAHA